MIKWKDYKEFFDDKVYPFSKDKLNFYAMKFCTQCSVKSTQLHHWYMTSMVTQIYT